MAKSGFDPSGTTSIRRGFMADFSRRLNTIISTLRKAVMQDDIFGLGKTERPIFTNADTPGKNAYKFSTDREKVAAFSAWFTSMCAKKLLGVEKPMSAKEISQLDPKSSAWWEKTFISSAYKKGVRDAYVTGKQEKIFTMSQGTFSADEMAKNFFYQPVIATKVAKIYTRSYTKLNNYTKDMAKATSEVLAKGLADGLGMQQLAKNLTGAVEITRARAMSIARTEVMNAHAEGTLDNFEAMGVEEVHVLAEWNTAGDSRVCARCQPKQDDVYTLAEARGVLPFHPNCRCAWVPILEDDLPKGKKVFGGKPKATKKPVKAAKPKTITPPPAPIVPPAEVPAPAAAPAPIPAKPTQIDSKPVPVVIPVNPLSKAKLAKTKPGNAVESGYVQDSSITLGGSTGAKVVIDKEGNKWVAKDYSTKEQPLAMIQNELFAQNLYSALKVDALKGKIDIINGKPAILTKYEEGGKTLGKMDAKSKEGMAAINNLRKGFVVDAWLGNWDVIGLDKDNVMTVGGKMTRIDQGGAMLFRAQGTPKGAAFGNTVPEIHNMRDKGVNPSSASVFGVISDKQVEKQIDKLKTTIDKAGGIQSFLHKQLTKSGIKDDATRNMYSSILTHRYADLLLQRAEIITKASQKLAAEIAAKPVYVPPKPKLVPVDKFQSTINTQPTDGTASLSYERKSYPYAPRKAQPIKTLDEIRGAGELGCRKLTGAESSAVTNFTRSSSSINQNAIQGKPNPKTKAIDSALNKLDRFSGTTFRGVNSDPRLDVKFEQWKSGQWAHTEWSAFSSTTINPEKTFGAHDVLHNVLYVIQNNGKTNIGGYIESISAYGGEKEYLLGRGARFKVVGWDEPSNARFGRVVFLQELEPGEEAPITQAPPPRIDSNKYIEYKQAEYNKMIKGD